MLIDIFLLWQDTTQRRLANVSSMPHLSRVSSINLTMLAAESKKKKVGWYFALLLVKFWFRLEVSILHLYILQVVLNKTKYQIIWNPICPITDCSKLVASLVQCCRNITLSSLWSYWILEKYVGSKRFLLIWSGKTENFIFFRIRPNRTLSQTWF